MSSQGFSISYWEIVTLPYYSKPMLDTPVDTITGVEM